MSGCFKPLSSINIYFINYNKTIIGILISSNHSPREINFRMLNQLNRFVKSFVLELEPQYKKHFFLMIFSNMPEPSIRKNSSAPLSFATLSQVGNISTQNLSKSFPVSLCSYQLRVKYGKHILRNAALVFQASGTGVHYLLFWCV